MADRDACLEALTSLTSQARNTDRLALAKKMCEATDMEAELAKCDGDKKRDPRHTAYVSTDPVYHCREKVYRPCNMARGLTSRLEELDELDQACDGGDARACLDASMRLSPIFVIPYSFEASVLSGNDLFYRDSLFGEGSGRSTKFDDDASSRLYPDFTRARALAEKSCELDLEDGCALVKNYYPVNLTAHTSEALSEHEAACKSGTEGACAQMLRTSLFVHTSLYSFYKSELDLDALEQRQALDARLGESLARACRRGDVWSCDLIARAALDEQDHAIFALPERLDAFSKKMCRTDAGKSLCMVVQSTCTRDPRTCSPEQKEALFTHLGPYCEAGLLEACHAYMRVCRHSPSELVAPCPPPLPEMDTLRDVYDGRASFMWEDLLSLVERSAPRRYRHEDLTPAHISWMRWHERLAELIYERYIALCQREGVCLFGTHTSHVDPARVRQKSPLHPIYTRYREVIATQCIEHGRACETWTDKFEKTREEWVETRHVVRERCMRGDAQLCRLFLTKLHSTYTAPTEIEARLCELESISPCPWTRARDTLTRCEQHPQACRDIIKDRELRLHLPHKQRLEIASAMCRGGDLKSCRELTSTQAPLSIQAIGHAHLCLAARDDETLPRDRRRRFGLTHCQRALTTSSGARRVEEFTEACHERDEMIACQALEYLHHDGYQTPVVEEDRIAHLMAAKKGCELGSDMACTSLYFNQIDIDMKKDRFRSFEEMERHQEIATRFLTKEVTVDLARASCERGEAVSCEVMLEAAPAKTHLKSLWRGCARDLEFGDQLNLSRLCKMALDLDKEATFTHYREACDLAGSITECASYETLLRTARPREFASRKERFVPGCNAGVVSDCVALSAAGGDLEKLLTEEALARLVTMCEGREQGWHRFESCGRVLPRETPSESPREVCLRGGECTPAAAELVYDAYSIDWERDIALFEPACEEGLIEACMAAILYYDGEFFPRTRSVYFSAPSVSPPDVARRDRFVQIVCTEQPESALCDALRGLQMYHSEDMEVRAHAWHNFLNACLGADPRSLYGMIQFSEIYNVGHACKVADLMIPMHELDARAQVEAAARFFVRGGPPIGSWLHPEVEFVLRTQLELEELVTRHGTKP